MTATTGAVHGFPAELTSFVGRAGPAREVASLLEELGTLLVNERSRSASHGRVTVFGPDFLFQD